MTARPARSGTLRGRILAATGGTLVALLVAVSLGVLVVWRARIVADLERNALAVTRAFSVAVLETLIAAEDTPASPESLLDDYIESLMRDEPSIRSVTVFDEGGRVFATSELRPGGRSPVAALPRLSTSIYRDPRRGWVVEVNLPLRTGERGWGLLQVLYDAEPTRHELTDLFLMMGGATLSALVVLLLVLRAVVVHETRPLSSLAAGLAQLDLETGAGPDLPESDDEIGAVVGQFNRMKRRLAQSRGELVSAQRQIYHAERLASVGRLASGVAHEVNNPLNGIRSCLWAIRKDPDDRAQTAEYLTLIEEGISRIEEIVQKLLGFARKQSKQTSSVGLNDEARTVLALLSYRLEKAGVTVELDLAPDLPAVTGDPGLLQEVLMNLVLNAFDAVGEGGRVAIRTSAGSGTVVVVVEDDGCGIAAEDLPRVFDPFFTTKEPGKGTGLGLSVALGIAEAHGGTLAVASRPGQGARFTLTLPVGGAA